MSFLSNEPLYIGIETTNSTIKMVVLERKKQSWQLLHIEEFSLKECTLPISPFLSKGHITTLLSQRHVMMRQISFDLKREKDVYKALPFHTEPHLPFPIEEAVIQAEVKKKEPFGFFSMVHAVKEEFLKKHIEKMAALQIEADAITSPALALATLFRESHVQESVTQFLVYIGEEEGTLVLMKGSQMIDVRSFLLGKQGILELQKAILSLENQYPKENSKTILLFCKESSKWIAAIQKETGKSVHTLSPFIKNISSDQMTEYAICLGAALSQKGKNPLNFRQKHANNNPHKLIKKPLFLSFCLTTLCALLLGTGGMIHTTQRKEKALKKIEHILAFHGEKSFSNPLYRIDDYEQILTELEEKLSTHEAHYPLEAKIPYPSEILHWLAQEIQAAPLPLKELSIESIDYKLIHRPTPLLPTEQYQISVDIAFSAAVPNVKEAFYHFLENSSLFVDKQKPIEVSFFEGKGRAQFILKDRTHYGTSH